MGLSLITGASGHIGYALLKKLTDSGEKVRIFIRKDIPIFDEFDCERAYGDVTDLQSIAEACDGVDTVYHLAGIIDINPGLEELTRKVNVDGTKNVVTACIENGVKRLVYASSVDAIPPRPCGRVMTEIDHFTPINLEGTYAKTKAIATQYVLDKCRVGLIDAVVVQPGACIGPYDFKVSNVGEMVRMVMAGKFPVSLGFGAYNFVDVRDVADGMYAAAQKGKCGSCYILCGQRVTVDEFISMTSQACGRRTPKLKIPRVPVMLAAPLAEKYYSATGKTPLFTRYSIRKINSNCNFSIEKAQRELGYQPMPESESLKDMVEWIRENEE